ncbi:MAG TPA: B12-binding domain-containing protein [Acidimicrobiales bacterium]|nr:B12-binding domain-containing protein [Acidimicrobiales bacterium]
MTLAEAAGELGVHYMTVYRYVRTGRLPAVKDGANNWVIDSRDLAAAQSGPRRFDGGPAERRPDLVRRLLVSDEMGAWAVVESALSSGMEAEEVAVGLLGGAMRDIGELWAQGEVSVADEHRATSTGTRLVARLGARFGRRGVKRGAVVLAAPEGELHSLPVSVAANVLRWRGYDVVEVGAHTPADALAVTVAAEAGARPSSFVAAGICCTTVAALESGAQAITAIRERLAVRGLWVTVLAGGAAIDGEEHARALGADAYSGKRADELAEVLGRLGATPPSAA